MAYSTNPNLPKARAIALKLLIQDELPVVVAARKCGIHRSTLYRWRKKWEGLNKNVQTDNPNRPNRAYSRAHHLARCTWRIPTTSSRPHTSPTAVSAELVRLVLAVREQLKRCAEVVWHHLITILRVTVSLSSVRRILRRHHCFDGARTPRVTRDNPVRPCPTRPGELVQTDTIHHVDPKTGKRLYYYTVIDLFTRMTYVMLVPKLGPGHAARAVLEARDAWGFPIAMVQADNGPEYGRFFEQMLKSKGVAVRHSRLHRPNDNAHMSELTRAHRGLLPERQRQLIDVFLTSKQPPDG